MMCARSCCSEQDFLTRRTETPLTAAISSDPRAGRRCDAGQPTTAGRFPGRGDQKAPGFQRWSSLPGNCRKRYGSGGADHDRSARRPLRSRPSAMLRATELLERTNCCPRTGCASRAPAISAESRAIPQATVYGRRPLWCVWRSEERQGVPWKNLLSVFHGAAQAAGSRAALAAVRRPSTDGFP